MKPNTIYTGDCVEVMSKWPANSIDLVFFSPPYDAIRDYNGFSINLNALGAEVGRTLKDGGVAVCVIGDGTVDGAKTLTSFRLAVNWVDSSKMRLFETCIYLREGRPGAWWSRRFRVDHEYIHIFVKGQKPKSFNKEPLKIDAIHAGKVFHGTTRMSDGTTVKITPKVQADKKCRGTVWRYSTSNSESNPLKMKHPATLPDDMARDVVQCFSSPGDIVCDPTCGSGTSLVAAKQLRREYVGIDISSEYVAIANERLHREARSSILE